MNTFPLPSAPSSGSAVPAGAQGNQAASPDAAPTLEVRFGEILMSICSASGSLPPISPSPALAISAALVDEARATPAPGKNGGSEEGGEPAPAETAVAPVFLAGVPPGPIAAPSPGAAGPAIPAEGLPVALAVSSGSGGVTAEAPGAASDVAARAFPAPPQAGTPSEGGGEPAAGPGPDAAGLPIDGTRGIPGTADRPRTGGAALPEDAYQASMAATDGPAPDAAVEGTPQDAGSRTAVSTHGAPDAAPSGGARDRFVKASPAPPNDGPPASHPSGGKPAPASGENSSVTAVNLSGTMEAVDASEASPKRKGEAPFRGEERVEPNAPPAVAVERIAADKAAAPRVSAPAPAAPHAPRPVLLGENAFVLTRKSDTSVEVTLAPPGIGKLEIEVVVEKGVVNANITAADPAGREAIERSLPHIMEALARDGMAIGGFTVSLKERREQAGNAPGEKAPRDPMDRPPVSTIVRTAAASAGLVDLFV